MNKREGVEFLKQELRVVEAEFARKRDALLAAIEVLQPPNGQQMRFPEIVLPPAARQPEPKTIKALIMEFALKNPGEFTKSQVENYAKINYPGFLAKEGQSPRAVASALQKLTLQRRLERVSVGQNGSPSTYRNGS
jgi:hypothetical protein